MEQLINKLTPESFNNAMIGIEKEGLRVCRDGHISHAPHPEVFGSSLTHPCITTDFSEALLEIITPPSTSAHDALKFLTNTETFVHQQLPNEYLWAASMPCSLRGENDIPIARYGQTKLGKMKTTYRRGLAHRYGKVMQVIAGAHFNYSFSELFFAELQAAEEKLGSSSLYINQKYMALVRNIQRFGWLNLYLFGASPALCRSFTDSKPKKLKQFDKATYFHPYATSLRMSDIGYTNIQMHRNMHVSYDSIEAYIKTLGIIINTPHTGFEYINKKSGIVPQQLNSNVLQIENEHYTTVRPKQTPKNNESHFKALQKRGISYVELRSLDINPFSASGLELSQLSFLEILMYYCALEKSPVINQHEAEVISDNQNKVALYGRDPQLKINHHDNQVLLQHWALELMDKMQIIAEKLDAAHDSSRYSYALAKQRQRVVEPDLTLSAQILFEMREQNESFTDFVIRKSEEHHQFYQCRELPSGHFKYYESLSRISRIQHQNLEVSESTQTHIKQLTLNHVIA